MLTFISGVNYLVIIALLVALYYLFIGFYFYSSELKEIFLKKRRVDLRSSANDIEIFEQDYTADHTLDNASDHQNTDPKPMPFEQTTDETFDEVEQLILDLQHVIAESAHQKLEKETFLLKLSNLLWPHQDLKHSVFQPAINELIMTECEKYGYILLKEEEVLILW